MARPSGRALIPEIAKKMHEAGLIPSPNNVTRVIIDLQGTGLATIYIETLATESLLEIVGMLTSSPESLDVRVLDREETTEEKP